MSDLVAVEQPAPGIRRLVFGNGSTNTMTSALLAAFDTVLTEALTAHGTLAVLIAARGGPVFSMGLGLTGADGTGDAARLRAICARIDAAELPVVALVGGMASGGGCELALAAHYRVALRIAEFGLPDIAIGLPPAAGTTQRLPRLIHPEAALDLLLSGRPVGAAEAQRIGLVDSVVDDDLDTLGVRFAQGLIEVRAGSRPAPARPLPPFHRLQAAVAARRAALPSAAPVEAPARVLDCMDAAAVLPFAVALDYEAAAYEDCRDSAAFRALRHVALGEATARRRAVGWTRAARPVGEVGIWGGGATAAGLAASLLAVGRPVRLAAADETTLRDGVARVDAILFDAGGGAAGHKASQARLAGSIGPMGLASCEVLIEAGSGPWSEREVGFAALGGIAAKDSVLVGTGALVTPAVLVASGRRPEATIWLNLPDLVPEAGLAELVCAAGASEAAIATLGVLAQSIGRFALVATGESPILGLLIAALEAADALVEEGASPYAVDRALREWGLSYGPYELADRLGLQTLLALRAVLPEGSDPKARPILVAAQLVAEGRGGLAAGRGYYAYPEPGTRGLPDPALDALLTDARSVLGRTPRLVTNEEIRTHVLASMAQAGAGLLRRGVLRRAVEVDLALIHGAGLARWRGGPMRAADERGLLWLRRTLRTMAERPGAAAIWTPDPLIGDLIKTGRGLCDFDGRTLATPAYVSPA
ncbi:enoyl-CoA hydratase/isomerase family protein [Rhodovulum steppense]|uniref:Short chain enoyl-CoA hydratase /3-hydroxyacyl-CoA dehydrogenase n=1 Tax=Rhodovulum steppense TaxID=540251 RepID=A0A4R1YG41_9RHOB|nr:enoyl-CoA hydratase/isomerase family protein [Rhodovulum steppense]TCM75062.1 short chain enoyl-CoA hydratase /3-hydroxyacyl-CoA dehydrogenase [Rhodovulum steppense]